MKLTRTLWLMAALCCVPASVMVTGCGGGSSNLPAGTVAGTYSGTYEVTSGPDDGETGGVLLTIDGDGDITGTVSQGENTASFSGEASLTSGNFSVEGLFNDTNGEANGQIRANGSNVSGSGNFTLSNGNKGNIVFTKVILD